MTNFTIFLIVLALFTGIIIGFAVGFNRPVFKEPVEETKEDKFKRDSIVKAARWHILKSNSEDEIKSIDVCFVSEHVNCVLYTKTQRINYRFGYIWDNPEVSFASGSKSYTSLYRGE